MEYLYRYFFNCHLHTDVDTNKFFSDDIVLLFFIYSELPKCLYIY